MEVLIFGSFVVLAFVALAFHFMSRQTDDQRKSVSNVNFVSFQRSFFVVYFMALLGDWLQGPYVYKLYSYYGYPESQIAVLYVAGFASSVLFGTMTGPMADILGRKKMALSFCIIYSFCCLTKLSSEFYMLMIGRLFGGISTSMLFSTFESWYVYEHTERHGFPSEWIGITFSTATLWNGMLAIVAGVIANFSAEAMNYGPVAPFVIAIFPLITAFFILLKTWPENYGNRKNLKIFSSCDEGLRQILRNRKIFLVGCIQTAVESCMYIFVFLWTPVMMPIQPPFGMVFACFMVAIMIGSSIYSLLISKGYKAGETLRMCLIIIGISLSVCAVFASPQRDSNSIMIIYFAFIMFEVAIGMYFPAMSFTKSQVIPEAYRANVMNWFRVPMNVITCAALLCLHVDWISYDKRLVFGACLVICFLGLCATNMLLSLSNGENKNNAETKDNLSIMEQNTSKDANNEVEKERLIET